MRLSKLPIACLLLMTWQTQVATSREDLKEKVADAIVAFYEAAETTTNYAVAYSLKMQEDAGGLYSVASSTLVDIDAFQVVDLTKQLERFDYYINTFSSIGYAHELGSRFLRVGDEWYSSRGVGEVYNLVSSTDEKRDTKKGNSEKDEPQSSVYRWTPFGLPLASPTSIRTKRLESRINIMDLVSPDKICEQIIACSETGGILRATLANKFDPRLIWYIEFDQSCNYRPVMFQSLVNREKMTAESGWAKMDFDNPSNSVEPFFTTETVWKKSSGNQWLPHLIKSKAEAGPRGKARDRDACLIELKWVNANRIPAPIFDPDDLVSPCSDMSAGLKLLFK